VIIETKSFAKGSSRLPGSSKILGVAHNFPGVSNVDQAVDAEPLVFFKGMASYSIALNGHLSIPKNLNLDKVWVEVELAAVLGRKLYAADSKTALDAIDGVVIANDVTAENTLSRDHHLLRSKGLPGFTIVGNTFCRDAMAFERAKCRLKINGETMQDDVLSNRFRSTAECVSLVSQMIPLNPGDIVLTGTPANAMNCLVKVGDTVCMEIEGLEVYEFSVQ
jgi:2,4-diketo-3-deoxy-L-fuconate hydrolase